MKLIIGNSYCKLEGDNDLAHSSIKNLLTYRNEIDAERNQIFGKMKYFRSIGDKKKFNACEIRLKILEESEWVCWYNDQQFPTGHLNMVKDLLNALGVILSVVDNRDLTKDSIILRWKNKPFTPRGYQQEVIDLCTKAGRGVIESAVGTGKTLMMGYIIKDISVKTLIVVPSRGLKEQISEEMTIWFGTKNVQVLDGAQIRKGKVLKNIRIVTVQTLAALRKTGDLAGFLSDIEAIFFDEVHHAGSKSYTDLLHDMNHISWRFGFTGTFMRNDSKSLDLWGVLSNKLYSYPAWKAIEDGYLTPIQLITHQMEGKKGRNYQKEYDVNYCGNQDILEKVAEIIYDSASGDQILILVNKKDKAGKLFHEYLNALGVANTYISGDDKSAVITQTIKDFNDKKINILIGSSVLGEGIDLRSADHLLLCQGGKSEIAIVQATGRLVRLFEGKQLGYLHDFDFKNTKYMTKHCEVRLDIIRRNFQPVKEIEV